MKDKALNWEFYFLPFKKADFRSNEANKIQAQWGW